MDGYNREVLWEDNDGCKLWCVRGYDESKLSDFAELDLIVEPEFRMYGRTMRQRRCVGFFSDESSGYNYSKQTIPAQPLTKRLSELMEKVNSDFGLDYNGILVNKYRTGNDYVSPHGDDERGLSHNIVMSLAYGAVRKFRISDESGALYTVEHEPGMLLCMDGEEFQRKYKHGIPQQKRVKEERLSLTFRKHK